MTINESTPQEMINKKSLSSQIQQSILCVEGYSDLAFIFSYFNYNRSSYRDFDIRISKDGRSIKTNYSTITWKDIVSRDSHKAENLFKAKKILPFAKKGVKEYVQENRNCGNLIQGLIDKDYYNESTEEEDFIVTDKRDLNISLVSSFVEKFKEYLLREKTITETRLNKIFELAYSFDFQRDKYLDFCSSSDKCKEDKELFLNITKLDELTGKITIDNLYNDHKAEIDNFMDNIFAGDISVFPLKDFCKIFGLDIDDYTKEKDYKFQFCPLLYDSIRDHTLFYFLTKGGSPLSKDAIDLYNTLHNEIAIKSINSSNITKLNFLNEIISRLDLRK